MYTHIIGKLDAFTINRAAGIIALTMADGSAHKLLIPSDLSVEELDTISLSRADDVLIVVARDVGMEFPALGSWQNRMLTPWLSELKRAEAERLAVLRVPLEQALQACLVELGWVAEDGTAIASKMYDTAVGPRQAHVYVQDYGPQEGSVSLFGDYHSEGRNCLSTCSVSVPRFASAEDIRPLVLKFVTQADKAVGESYAARLLRRTESA